MLFSSHVAVCLAALAAAVTANPLPQDRDIIPGYSIVPMQWSVKPFPDRDEYVNVTGTIQQMIAEVNKVNPDYEKLLLAAADKYREESGNLDKRGLNKRWVYAGHFCFGRWPGASILAIEEGISYLNSIGGRPHIGSGPGVCSRVSCSNNAGIFWCNDHNGAWTLGNFRDISSAATIILGNCRENSWKTAGQIFTTDDWNVVVHGGDRC